MPIFFVSIIYIYEKGFDKINEFPEDFLESINAARERELYGMMELQFLLSYLGNISKADSDEMTPFELNNWYEFLKKQKELESSRLSEK